MKEVFLSNCEKSFIQKIISEGHVRRENSSKSVYMFFSNIVSYYYFMNFRDWMAEIIMTVVN